MEEKILEKNEIQDTFNEDTIEEMNEEGVVIENVCNED
jgi:uncharacterized coiled-coil protein SlyX